MAEVIGIDEKVATYIVTGLDTRTGREVSLSVMPDGRLEVRRTDYVLAKDVIANGTVTNCPKLPRGVRSAEATLEGTGAVSVVITLYGNSTNSGTGGTLAGTFTLSGTGRDEVLGPNDGEDIAEYDYYYVTASGLTGTGAKWGFVLSVGAV